VCFTSVTLRTGEANTGSIRDLTQDLIDLMQVEKFAHTLKIFFELLIRKLKVQFYLFLLLL
jgi:hypothetical protein